MRAITLWQPWASLIAFKAKPFETRSWAPPAAFIGQRIAIHAAARPVPRDIDQETADAITDAFGRCAWNHWLPRGAIVCTAVLSGAYQVFDYQPRTGRATFDNRVSGSPPLLEIPADEFGDYSRGRWCWHLTDIEPVDPPFPAKGAQGFWVWGGR